MKWKYHTTSGQQHSPTTPQAACALLEDPTYERHAKNPTYKGISLIVYKSVQ